MSELDVRENEKSYAAWLMKQLANAIRECEDSIQQNVRALNEAAQVKSIMEHENVNTFRILQVMMSELERLKKEHPEIDIKPWYEQYQ